MKRLFPVVGALLLATMLTACAFKNDAVPVTDDTAKIQDAEARTNEFLGNLGRFTLNDLNAAMDLTGDIDHDGHVDPGLDNGDPIADACYFFLAGKVQSVGSPDGNTVTVAGVVSGFQAARNIKRRVGGFDGFSDEFMLGCGPLITDVRGDVLKIIAKVGSKTILPF
jgi:hypothetical protein